MTAMSELAPVEPFVISREINAPRELVWKSWTESERLTQWWGPKGATVGYAKMDFRQGGTFHYRFHYAGQDMWGKKYYREIVKPERIVFINTFSDEQGAVTHHPLSPTWPAELLTTVTFEEREGKTTVTIEWTPINATAEELKTFDEGRGSMKQGWTGTLDQLADLLVKG